MGDAEAEQFSAGHPSNVAIPNSIGKYASAIAAFSAAKRKTWSSVADDATTRALHGEISDLEEPGLNVRLLKVRN